MLDQIAVDVLSSVVLAVIIILFACSEPSGLSDTEHSTCLERTQLQGEEIRKETLSE
jgi:hypothetical protein